MSISKNIKCKFITKKTEMYPVASYFFLAFSCWIGFLYYITYSFKEWDTSESVCWVCHYQTPLHKWYVFPSRHLARGRRQPSGPSSLRLCWWLSLHLLPLSHHETMFFGLWHNIHWIFYYQSTDVELIQRRVLKCGTFMSGLCNVNNISNIWCQFGKEWNGNSCTDPAADVTHQHWVLIKNTNNIWSHKTCFWHRLKKSKANKC